MTSALALLLGLAACSATSGMEKTLFVAPERKPCTGVAPMECLQVRSAADQPWQYFYSQIEGFTHEPGFDYELRVREEKVANPPADGSSVRWTLVRVVSKRAAASAPAP
jgi:heat shock protein HslJ